MSAGDVLNGYEILGLGRVFSRIDAYATTSTHRSTAVTMDSPEAENAEKELNKPWEIMHGHREPPR